MLDNLRFTANTTNKRKTQLAIGRSITDNETGNIIWKSQKTAEKEPILRLVGERFQWKGGSVHKDYNFRKSGFRENLTPCTHEDLVKEFEFLVDTYSLDPTSIQFTYLEVGFNLKVRRPVQDYLSSAAYFVGENGHHYLLAKDVKNGKLFKFKHKGDCISVKGYDKCEDSKIAKPIRASFSNVFRVEAEIRRSAICFPQNLQQLLEISHYNRLIDALRDHISRLRFFDITWTIVNYPREEKPSNLKQIAHLLLKYAEGHEDKLLHDLESLPIPSDKLNDIRKAMRNVLDTRPPYITDHMLSNDLLIAFDREVANYFGKEFIMDERRYGMEVDTCSEEAS